MDFLELLFALLNKFVDFEPSKLARLKSEAYAWQNEQEEKDGIVAKAINFQKLWYIQILCAILYIVGLKQIANYLMSVEHPEMFDENTQEEQGPTSFKKYML